MPLAHPVPEMLRDLSALCNMVEHELSQIRDTDDSYPLFTDSVDWAYSRGVCLGRAAGVVEVAQVVNYVRSIDPDTPPSSYGDGRFTAESGHLTFHMEMTAALLRAISKPSYGVPSMTPDLVGQSQQAGERRGMFQIADLATESMHAEMASYRLYAEGVEGAGGDRTNKSVAADFRSTLAVLLTKMRCD